MDLPEQVIFVIERIHAAGGQAWLVGGSVRDMLLKAGSGLCDIATTLRPDSIEGLFPDLRPYTAGKRFGTVSVLINGTTIEITTLRGEDSYTDSRHPDRVYFISDIESDLARRDFTINAIAYDPLAQYGIVDPFMGRHDLAARVIRTVGDPRERLEEDPLRMLRAIRLAAQLGFDIDKCTWQAIKRLHPLLDKVAFERIRDELSKLLLSPCLAAGFDHLTSTGAINMIFPRPGRADLSPGQAGIISGIDPVLTVRLAALCFYLYPGKSDTEIMDMLKSLRFSRAEAKDAASLIRGFKALLTYDPEPYNIRKLLSIIGQKDMSSLIVWYAEAARAHNSRRMSDRYSKIRQMYEEILQNRDPVSLKDLAITGRDIINAGIGKHKPEEVGEALRTAHDWVLHNPKLNSRDKLLEELLRIYSH